MRFIRRSKFGVGQGSEAYIFLFHPTLRCIGGLHEVPKGTLSCPNRNMAVFHRHRHYEGICLQLYTRGEILIQQTLFRNKTISML